MVNELQTSELTLEPGSFRDRRGKVFYRNGEVYRALDSQASLAWVHLEKSPFYARNLSLGRIVKTTTAESDFPLDSQWTSVVRHDRIQAISYPYEWCFSQLKEAALLQLDLIAEALADDITVRDATPYNIQWRGCAPVFIDIPSFRQRLPGESWTGYLQFCKLFLYPLLIQAHLDIPFHPLLRGNLDGIEPEVCARMFSWHDFLKAGVTGHVFLHSAMRKNQNPNGRLEKELEESGLGKELMDATVRKMRKLVESLQWKQKKSVWSDYTRQHSYNSLDFAAKERFVDSVCSQEQPSIVWDVGANTGHFSRLAAKYAELVLAIDGDHLAVERNFTELKSENVKNILPLCMNFADPSPGLGWRGQERTPLAYRAQPDLVLCLAVVHHLVLAANLHLDDLVDFLAELTPRLIIEFVTREDPMVGELLKHKEDVFHDYTLEHFQIVFEKRFEIVSQTRLDSGTRVLFYGKRTH